MTAFIKRLLGDRRAATAVAMAILAVPLLIAASAAVDFSRVASARALLQASADAAAIAGAGAWQTSQSYSYASSVTSAAYSGTASQLSKFVATSGPTPELTCTGTTTQCGGTASSSTYVTTTSTYGCPSSSEYCVVVQATGVLKNSLFAWLIPSETLTVRSMATTAFPPTTINGSNIPPSPGFGSAGDVSGIYAYAVPMSGTGSNATPEYNQMPTPNSACTGYTTIGPLAQLTHSTGTASTCNYLFIALSTSSGTAGTGGSITLQQNQPIAFSFINYTGANGYHSSAYNQTSTNLMVYKNGSTSGTYYAGTTTIDTHNSTSYTTTAYRCSPSQLNWQGNCPTTGTPYSTSSSSHGTDGTVTNCVQTKRYGSSCSKYETDVTTSSTTVTSVTLTGNCPDITLYGSLDPISVNATTGANTAGIPVADSLNVYSSAYEVLGYPPTYETNHALTPFIAPTSLANQYTDSSGNTYTVRAVCPNYDRSNTSISAPISSAYATLTGWTGLNIYSTAFPGQTYSDSSVNTAQDSSGNWMTSDSGDKYPPAIAGCTPATSAEDGGVTSTSTDPWWNWNSSNSGNCSNETSTQQSSYLSSGQPTYNNCALLIQPLGTAVPVNSNNQALLPDYYLLVENSSGMIVGMDPVWDGQLAFTDLMPGIITNHLGGKDNNITINTNGTIEDTDTAPTYNSSGQITNYGYTPSSTNSYTVTFSTATDGLPAGTYQVVIEPPAYSDHYDFNPPQDTSSQCYNPRANGNAAGYATIQEGGGAR